MKNHKTSSEIKKVTQITFSNLFPNIKEENINFYLKDIPTHSAIEVVTHWNFLETTNDRSEHPLHFLLSFCLKVEISLQHIILDFINKVDNNINLYLFTNTYAFLELTKELVLVNNKQTKELSREDYSNLLKAYLICCERGVINKINPIDNSKIPLWYQLSIPFWMKNADLSYSLIYSDLGIVKFNCFIDFCKLDADFNGYTEIYLKKYGLSSLNDYIYSLYNLYLTIKTNEEKSHKFILSEDSEALRNLLDEMSINNKTYTERSSGFNMLKEKPIFKLDEKTYIVISIKFFQDKFFRRFILDLNDVVANSDITNPKKINVKSALGQSFSEYILFYQVMNRCFTKHSFVKYTGKELKETLGDGEPDFYLRENSNVFLFEYKDVRLNDYVKYSDSYKIIEQELFSQFFQSEKNGKISPKGGTQLLNAIENKITIILEKIDSVSSTCLNIFPVIVYQDPCLDIDGINHIINKKFYDLKESYHLNGYEVKDVVMINIDTLMKLESLFASNQLDLGTCINNYIKHKQIVENNSFISFNRYLMNEAFDKGYRLKYTRWFRDIMSSLKPSNQ